MAHAERLKGIAAQMQRVADEARKNAVTAEDTLAQLEDRERRRTARQQPGNVPPAVAARRG